MFAIGSGVVLQRLYRRADADWNASPPDWRNGHVDPPEAHRALFGVLYLADAVITAAFECRVLSCSRDEVTGDARFEMLQDESDNKGLMPLPQKVTSHKVRTPIAFVDIEDTLLRDRFHLERVQSLLSRSAKNAKWTNCKLVLSQRSQFLHNRRFFSSQAKLRSTIQRLGITTNLCNSLRLAICTVTPAPKVSHTPCAKGSPT